MSEDAYARLAPRYDRMIPDNPERDSFFRGLFGCRSVRAILDCACGTGRDVIAFHGWDSM
jgi:ubiquinone/menaquinone biosynthesis C-methylase UbiE